MCRFFVAVALVTAFIVCAVALIASGGSATGALLGGLVALALLVGELQKGFDRGSA